MLNTAQTDHRVLRVNMLDVMRSAVLRDGDGSDVFLLPTLADLSSDSGWSQIRSATSFAELLPNTGAPNLIRSSSIFASYLADREGVETNSVQCSDSEELVAHEGHFTLIQIQPSAVPTEYHRQDEYSNW